MAIPFQDYYFILGVSRKATADEIKAAYRQLARRYHPDLRPGDAESERRFKEVTEAYEVLGDSTRRGKYDRLDGSDIANSQRRPESNTYSDFFNALFGNQSKRRSRSRSRRRRHREKPLRLTLEEVHEGGTKDVALAFDEPCSRCQGIGTHRAIVCLECMGAGKIHRKLNVSVTLPLGIRNESTIRVSEQGGLASETGEAERLLLKVELTPHRLFSLVGTDDLQIDVKVSPWESVFGAKIDIPTLTGSAQLTVPPRSQGGQLLRLKGLGMSKPDGDCGDLFVKLWIVVPRELTERELLLFRQLADESRFNARSDIR